MKLNMKTKLILLVLITLGSTSCKNGKFFWEKGKTGPVNVSDLTINIPYDNSGKVASSCYSTIIIKRTNGLPSPPVSTLTASANQPISDLFSSDYQIEGLEVDFANNTQGILTKSIHLTSTSDGGYVYMSVLQVVGGSAPYSHKFVYLGQFNRGKSNVTISTSGLESIAMETQYGVNFCSTPIDMNTQMNKLSPWSGSLSKYSISTKLITSEPDPTQQCTWIPGTSYCFKTPGCWFEWWDGTPDCYFSCSGRCHTTVTTPGHDECEDVIIY